MTQNNTILNRLFTQKMIHNLVHSEGDTTFNTVIQRYINDPMSKNHGKLISEIYKFMSEEYRNEYFYQNTLLNKLLLGKHSINTTSAISQIPINKSKADFILINGNAVVYEIKTELDSFDRLKTQIEDYFQAFNHVCVVTSESQYYQAEKILRDTPVGIYTLSNKNTISSIYKKEPIQYNSELRHEVIFKVLHKHEFENILLQLFGGLPTATQACYYSECLRKFTKIPILDAYKYSIKQLKMRNRIEAKNFEKIPYELKSLIYFSKPRKSDWKRINNFLHQEYGG